MTDDREQFRFPVAAGHLAGWVAGAGDSVLALHGGPGLSYGYLDGMVEELAAGYRVATYQQRGLAPSTTEGPFTVDQEVADACAVLDGLGWERAWVVGHSWGGHLVLHLARDRPERLLGGLAVDPLGGVGDGGQAAMGARFGAWSAGNLEPVVEPEGAVAGAEAMVAGLRRIWPAYFAVPEDAPPMPDIDASPDAYQGIFDTIRQKLPALEQDLPKIAVEVGFVAGEMSPLVPAESSVPTAAAMPNAWLVMVRAAGHFPWVEEPGCVRRAMDRLAGAAG